MRKTMSQQEVNKLEVEPNKQWIQKQMNKVQKL